MIDRSVPFDMAAECAVLGSILIDREAILSVCPTLHPDDFYLEKHALVYDAMLACLNRRVPPDLITVAGELRQRAHLDLIGGLVALGDFMTEVPTAVHIGYYAENITRTATLRRLIQAGGTIAALGYAEETELDTTLDQAEQTLFAVSQRQRGADFVPISTVVAHYFARAQSEDVERVVPTGLIDLDRRLNGGLAIGLGCGASWDGQDRLGPDHCLRTRSTTGPQCWGGFAGNESR